MGFSRKRPLNPFYIALVVIGIVFTITACAYGVMTVQQMTFSANRPNHPLMTFLDQYGVRLFAIELVLLAVATTAAIGTDGFWVRLHEKKIEKEAMRDEGHSSRSG